MTEKQFQQQILELASLTGWLTYHTYDSRRCTPGFPDLIIVKGGRIIAAELKVGKNKLTAEQQRWLDALRETTVEVYEWRPTDWSLIEQTLGLENV